MDLDISYRTFSISTAAKKLNLSRNTVLQLIEENKIRILFIGKRRRISEQELQRFINLQNFYNNSIKINSLSMSKKKFNKKRNKSHIQNIVNEIIGGYNGIYQKERK